MIDPLSAVSLAGSIFTFIDFSCKLVSKSREIYKSADGSCAENSESKAASIRLGELSRNLRHGREVSQEPLANEKLASEQLSHAKLIHIEEDEHTVSGQRSDEKQKSSRQHEIAIQQLADASIEVAEELKDILDKIQAKPQNALLSVGKAIESTWKKNKIRDMDTRLRKISSELVVHLTAVLVEQQSATRQLLDGLSHDHRRIEIQSAGRLNDVRNDLLQAIKQSEIQLRSNMQDLQCLSHNLSGLLTDLAVESQNFAKTKAILESLRFTKMKYRHRTIHEKHGHTFEWVFDPTHAGREIHFSQWLEAGDRTFLIVGKAGSGKSTLMKSICQHPTTMDLLRKWANGQTLITASFFFWASGNELEKSQEGLLRSILFEVLRQCPDVVLSLPKDLLRTTELKGGEFQAWTTSELLEIFNVIAKWNNGSKFCFFIDGLDEYAGEPRALLSALETFIGSPCVKLCLASRPRPAFNASFGQNPKLVLTIHEHTQDDIARYVHEVLEADTFFRKLRAEDKSYQSILKELVEKANGVFLWIFLVVRNIRNCLPNYDTFEELQSRVQHFPRDLEPYFYHMLESIDESYWQSSSETLLMCLDSEEPVPIMALYFVVERKFDAGTMPLSRWSEETLQRNSEMTRIRLQARCPDLLETVTYSTVGWTTKLRVDFLHRTVYDFFHLPEVRAKILSRLSPDFESSEALCRVFLAQLKVSSPACSANETWEIVDRLLYYARLYESRTNKAPLSLLNTAEPTVQALTDKPTIAQSSVEAVKQGNKSQELDVADIPHLTPFFLRAIEWGLTIYVSERLNKPTELPLKNLPHSPLAAALLAARGSLAQGPHISSINPKMVDLLLRSGADPNELRGSQTVWGHFLLELTERSVANEEVKDAWTKVVVSLVRAGADVRVKSARGTVLLTQLLIHDECVDIYGLKRVLTETDEEQSGQNYDSDSPSRNDVKKLSRSKTFNPFWFLYK